jgi:cytochrome b561
MGAACGAAQSLGAVFHPVRHAGYLFSSAGGYSLKYFWTFSWPRLVVNNQEVARIGETSHDLLAWFVYAVVALHIAATFWHVVVKKDETLARMWPGARKAASKIG